jgi:hypothetical protein
MTRAQIWAIAVVPSSGEAYGGETLTPRRNLFDGWGKPIGPRVRGRRLEHQNPCWIGTCAPAVQDELIALAATVRF